MAKELETFFLVFYDNINKINTKYENANDNISRNGILGSYKGLIYDIIYEISCELKNDPETQNDANQFHNNIFNPFMIAQNELKMSDFLKRSLMCSLHFCQKSKDIISNFVDMIYIDNYKFINDKNDKRSKLYLKKLQINVLSKWKISKNNDYYQDYTEYNTLLQKIGLNYYPSMDIYSSIALINNINKNIDEFIIFFEKLTEKYNKYDKLDNIKNTIVKQTIPKSIIENTNIVKETKTTKKIKEEEKNDNIEKETKTRKKKEKIPASVKNTLWRLHFNDNIEGKCNCCKVESISKQNFHCGHIISEKNGGEVNLDNLKPICASCNSSMGTMNMNDFITKYGFDKIK